MSDPVRIAMWSGPRNISTAMMRAFENREDAAVIDEPFYAAYLAATGLPHPMRAEVMAAQPLDFNDAVRLVLGPVPGDRAIFYQKHMTHHMLPQFDRGWMAHTSHAFLIRAPELVLRSYAQRRESVTLDDIGFRQQAELFDETCQLLGHAPPVVDAMYILANPEAALKKLCGALGIGFSPRMLNWPAGPRATDGVWAPAWYASVHRSTGFTAPPEPPGALEPSLQRLAVQARPYYDRLSTHRI